MAHVAGSTLKPLVKLPRDPADCWTWLGNLNTDGVPIKQFAGKPMVARRWLWQQLFGPIPDGLVVSLACGNKACMNPAHMRATTQAVACRSGCNASLLPDDVREIRNVPEEQRSATAGRVLAERFGVSLQTVRDLWRGRSWSRARKFRGPKQPRNQHSAPLTAPGASP